MVSAKKVIGKANNRWIWAILYIVFSSLLAYELIFNIHPNLIEMFRLKEWNEMIVRLTIFACFLYAPALVLSKFHKMRTRWINAICALFVVIMYVILKISFNTANEIAVEIKALCAFLIVFSAIPMWIHSIKLTVSR